MMASLATVWLSLLLLQCTMSEPIFFEIFGNSMECIYDHYEEKEVMEFFYEIRAGQNEESELEIKIMTETNDLMTTRRGYQNRVNYEVHTAGIYKICFEVIGHGYYDRTVVGIEMLGYKSETYYHANKDKFAKKEHIDPMYAQVIAISCRMDELEALHSSSKNWEIKYWDQLLFTEESLGFYKWIQGWILLLVSIFQIRMIRQWFAKVGTRIRTSGKHRSSYFRV